MSRILLLNAHSILEYDELRLYTELGHDCFSVGAYVNPAAPADDKRPPLPQAPYHPDLAELVAGNQMERKANLPLGLLDWAEVAIISAFEGPWLAGQWPKWQAFLAQGKRVVWRTIGQSTGLNEAAMVPLAKAGLEIVRYSPKERNLVPFAGETALIRFYKDPAEWGGWVGDDRVVTNVTQDLFRRHPATNFEYWALATEGLPTMPIGSGSSEIGGSGPLSYPAMQAALRDCRAYLYTGTQPASYTLGLIEAMMTGIPTFSIGPGWMMHPELFEGHEIVTDFPGDVVEMWSDNPSTAQRILKRWLEHEGEAERISRWQRKRAIELFGKHVALAAWGEFLG